MEMRVGGRAGALVRAGVEKTTAIVGTLARDTAVTTSGAAGVAADGTRRAEVVAPLRGWVSASSLVAAAPRAAALEPSPHCRRLLRARGIDAHGDARGLAGRVFDVVSLQNVLDRCADPRALLQFAASALRDGPSRLWVALRLPVDAYQLNWDGSVAPQAAPLPADLAGAETWEASASAAVDFLEDATGLELERLSRVPYVTIARRRPGELLDSLDDALFVLRRRSA